MKERTIRALKIEPGKSYDLANFKLHDFITEFDKLMNAIRSDEAEKEKTEYTHMKLCRKPDGISLEKTPALRRMFL